MWAGSATKASFYAQLRPWREEREALTLNSSEFSREPFAVAPTRRAEASECNTLQSKPPDLFKRLQVFSSKDAEFEEAHIGGGRVSLPSFDSMC